MGFFDSLKGFGAGVLDIFGQGVQAVLPSFLEAGAGALFGSLFPGQQPAGSQVFRRPALGPIQQRPLQLPPGARLPPRQQLPLDPRFSQPDFPRPLPPGGGIVPLGTFPLPQLPRGTQMPHFPGDPFQVTQAAFPLALPLALGAAGGALGAAGQFFDIPGVDLRLPFTADARTGGNAFFHGVGAVRQRPRSLIMQMNPSTGTPTFFRHAGRPIMFSGDRALCKSIDKIARRAGRSRPRR